MDEPIVRTTAHLTRTTEPRMQDYSRVAEYGQRPQEYGQRVQEYGQGVPDYGQMYEYTQTRQVVDSGRRDGFEDQSGGTLTRRLRRLNTMLEDQEDPNENMEPNLEDTSHMTFVDGRCSCCPYGYHIDTDFLRYCDTLNDATYLKNLKKIKRNKRKLRKSMEIFLEDQKRAEETGQVVNGPPPDVVKTHNEQFIRAVEAEDKATRRILSDIDSSVNATLTSIDSQLGEQRRPGRRGPEYDYDSDASLNSPSPVYPRGYSPFNPKSPGPPVPPKPATRSPGGSNAEKRYRTETAIFFNKPAQPLVPTLTREKSESVSSLDSHSTQSSEPPYMTAMQTTERTVFSSSQLEEMMSNLPRPGEVQVNGDMSGMVMVNQRSLDAMREQMSLALRRMRELEEQVKAIPVLQVRISVLKEEKRLLMLQLKAKSSKLNMRTIGVGDYRVDEPDTVDHGLISPSSDTYQSFVTQSLTRSGYRSQTPDRPRPIMRSVGVGDSNVFAREPTPTQALVAHSSALVASQQQSAISTDRTVHTQEKEIRTVVLGQGIDRSDYGTSVKSPPPVSPKPKVKTRNIGIGDFKVDDVTAGLDIESKELRTVIIGQDSEPKQTRNVGIECRVPMRDVGISYMYDEEMPFTKNVAVGVGEIGVYWQREEEGGSMEQSESISSQSVSNIMQQLKTTQWRTTNVELKQTDLRLILDEMLKKDVHSKSTQAMPEVESKQVQHEGTVDLRTIGCGDDSIDVEVTPIKQMRSVGVENRPTLLHRSVATDKGFTLDAQTNTQKTQVVHRSTTTAPTVRYHAGTNTEVVRQQSTDTETDIRVFMALDEVKNTAVNTTRVQLYDAETSTAEAGKITKAKGVNTEGVRSVDRAVTTEKVRMVNRAVGDSSSAAVITDSDLDQADRRAGIEQRILSSRTDATVSRQTYDDVAQERVSEDQEQQQRDGGEYGVRRSVRVIRSYRDAEPVVEQTTRTRRFQTSFSPERQADAGDTSSSSISSTRFRSSFSPERGADKGDGTSSTVTRITKTTRTYGRQDSDSDRSKTSPDRSRVTTWPEQTVQTTKSTQYTKRYGNEYEQVEGSPSARTTVRTIRQTSSDSPGEEIEQSSGAAVESSSRIIRVQSKTDSSRDRDKASSPYSWSSSRTTRISSSSPERRGGDHSTISQMQASSYTGPSSISQSSGSTSRIVGYKSRFGFDKDQSGGVDSSKAVGYMARFGFDKGESSPTAARESLGDDSTVIATRETVPRTGGDGLSSSSSSEVTRSSSITRSEESSGRGLDLSDRQIISRLEPERSVTTTTREVAVTRVSTRPQSLSSDSDKSEGYSSSWTTHHVMRVGSHDDSESLQDSQSGWQMEESGTRGSRGTSKGSTEAQSGWSSSTVSRVGGDIVRSPTEHSYTTRTVETKSSRIAGPRTFESSGGFLSSPEERTKLDDNDNITGSKVIKSSTRIAKSGFSGQFDTGSEGRVSDKQSDSRVIKVEKDDQGDNQMRVIEHIETAYVGDIPVHRTSSLEFQDELGSSDTRDSKSGDFTDKDRPGYKTRSIKVTRVTSDTSRTSVPQRFVQKTESQSSRQDESFGTDRSKARSVKTEDFGMSGEVGSESFDGRSDQSSGDIDTSGLKGIMKTGSTSSTSSITKSKKGISFAEDVVGGYVSSSDEEQEGGSRRKRPRPDGEGEEEESGEGSEDSFDEGEYDGQLGQVTYTRKAEEGPAPSLEAMEGQLTLSDQNIRETYELSDKLRKACEVYAQWLEDSTEVASKQLNGAQDIIQKEWFEVSSKKLSDVGQVEDYLSSVNEISRDLLQHVVNMADSSGNTAIHYAVSHCNTDVVTLLLDTELVDVDRPNKAGYTAIMLAALSPVQTPEQKEVIHRLFSIGDVNKRASQAGQTALMLAVSHGRLQMVEMLLACGAQVNLQDDDGSTALMCACEHGHDAIVKLLLAQPETDISITDHDGSNAMAIAMEAGHKDIGVLLYATQSMGAKQPGSQEPAEINTPEEIEEKHQ